MRTKAGAGLAGAGGGTLVAAIAATLPEGHPVKPYLMLAAPSIAIFASGIWLWVNVKIGNHLRDQEVKTVLAAARKTVDDQLQNPKCSPKRQAALQRELEDLDRLELDHHKRRLAKIRIISEDDIDNAR